MSGHGPNYDVGRKARRSFIVTAAVVGVLIVGQASANVISIFGIYASKDAADEAKHAATAVRQTQLKGSPTSKRLIALAVDVKAIADQINDCVQPDGECAKRGQQRTSAVLSLILVGISCAQGYSYLPDAQRIEATNECVSDWLEKHPRLFSQ